MSLAILLHGGTFGFLIGWCGFSILDWQFYALMLHFIVSVIYFHDKALP